MLNVNIEVEAFGIPEVAKKLKVKESTVKNWLKPSSGKLPPPNFPRPTKMNGRLRWSSVDFADFVIKYFSNGSFTQNFPTKNFNDIQLDAPLRKRGRPRKLN